MKYEVLLLPRAEEDISSVVAYYRANAPEVMPKFISEFRKVLSILEVFPSAGAQVNPAKRKISLKRFPYSVLYRLEANTVVVTAFVHMRRHPDTWI